MRKFSLVIALFFALGFLNTVLAQSDWRLGLKLNPIFSWARITDEDKKAIDGLEKNMKVGYAGGLMVDYNFSERMAFNTGLHIVGKGYKYNLTENSSYEVGVTAIEIPLALKMRSGDIMDGFRVRGLFGGALGFNVASKTTAKVDGFDPVESRKVSDYYQPVGLDFLVGVGVEYDIDGVGTLDLGTSYHNGLIRFNKKDEVTGVRTLLNYFAIDLGFYF